MRRYFPLTAAFTLCLAAPLAAGAQSVQPPPTGQPSSYVLDTEQLLGKRTLSVDPSVTTAPPATPPEASTTVAVPTTKKKAAAKKKATPTTPTTVAARILDPATAPTTVASTTEAPATSTAPKRVAWTPPAATKTPETKAPDTKSAPKATDSAVPDTAADNSTDANGIPASVWAALRKCESGGNYSINTGNGFYGAYQFAAATWRALGYPGLPHEAPPAMQDEAARKLQVKQGWGAWPACTRKLGLR